MSVSLTKSHKNGHIGNNCVIFSLKDCLVSTLSKEYVSKRLRREALAEDMLEDFALDLFNHYVIEKLHECVKSNHSIVIIEDSYAMDLSEFERYSNFLCKRVNFPMVFYYCTGNFYLKPLTTSLEELNIPKTSYYVGRPDGHELNPKRNFDKLFAMNYEIKFKSCNKFFNAKNHDKLSFYYCDPSSIKVCDDIDYRSEGQEMIILMGQPGSGKSHMAAVTGYEIIKKTDGWYPNLVKLLKEGKSVVIDECNPRYKDRDQFIRVAHKFTIPYKVIHIEMQIALSNHMCRYRKITEGIDYDEKEALSIFHKIQYHYGSIIHKFTVNKYDPLMRIYL